MQRRNIWSKSFLINFSSQLVDALETFCAISFCCSIPPLAVFCFSDFFVNLCDRFFSPRKCEANELLANCWHSNARSCEGTQKIPNRKSFASRLEKSSGAETVKAQGVCNELIYLSSDYIFPSLFRFLLFHCKYLNNVIFSSRVERTNAHIVSSFFRLIEGSGKVKIFNFHSAECRIKSAGMTASTTENRPHKSGEIWNNFPLKWLNLKQ